jgi:hypothetical protein
MRAVHLDFSVTGGTWRRWLVGNRTARGSGFGLPLLSIGLGAVGLLAWEGWQDHIQLTSVQDALQAARVAKGKPRPSTETVRPLLAPPQRTAWNQLVRQLNMPWSSLLDTLETASPDDIAVVSIEPDGAQGSVRLQVEAKTLDSLLAYAGTLKSIDLFDSVTLIKHETNDQESTKPLRLSLDIRLKSGTTSGPRTQEALR